MPRRSPSALKDGFTDAEVKTAKDGADAGTALRATRTASWPDRWLNQAFLGRTLATSGQIDSAIEKLTTADVNAVLRKYVKPDEFAYAFAGDFAKKK